MDIPANPNLRSGFSLIASLCAPALTESSYQLVCVLSGCNPELIPLFACQPKTLDVTVPERS
jgi:hypothetical protein